MLLVLDVGNTHIHVGVFKQDKIICQFRYSTASVDITSDQIGIFFRQSLREHEINPSSIKGCAISSVVPRINHSLGSAIIKYFKIKAFFINHTVQLGMDMSKIAANEVGADRMASCVGAMEQFPNKNLIVVDLGTATTIDIVTKDKVYLSGSIIPGVKLSLNALCGGASQLSSTTITKPNVAIGYDTPTNILSGLYFGHLGAIKEIISRSIKELKDDNIVIVATGGFSNLFKEENIFDVISPNLILDGTRITYLNNVKN